MYIARPEQCIELISEETRKCLENTCPVCNFTMGYGLPACEMFASIIRACVDPCMHAHRVLQQLKLGGAYTVDNKKELKIMPNYDLSLDRGLVPFKKVWFYLNSNRASKGLFCWYRHTKQKPCLHMHTWGRYERP